MTVEISRASSNAGTSAYAMMYAQQIVDHFSKALEENNCLVQFPIGMYVELDNLDNQLNDYIDAAVEAERDNKTNTDSPGYEEPRTSDSLTDEIVRSAIASVSDKCFNCKIEKPKFDFSDMFGNLMAQARLILDQFENMFKYKKASVCQYAFFLSYLCVPDLLKLIALILAAIVRLMQNINLPRITVELFISGILSAIISALVRNISILARFALTPVLCILDAIQDIISRLPTPENIRKTSGEDLKKLGIEEHFQGNTGASEMVESVRKAYTDRIKSFESLDINSTQQYAQSIFGPLENTINNAVSSLNDSVTELEGLLNHFQCEPGRSGISISDFLSNVSELMALLNLIRYIIQFKSGKAAMEKLCNTPTDGSNYGNDNSSLNDRPLTIENIGSIIAETIYDDIEIITSEDGDPIGIVIQDTIKNNPNSLTFWTCNLNDFIENINITDIITQEVENNIDKLNFPEYELGEWKVTLIPETEYTFTRPNTAIIPLKIDEVWNLPQHIKDIIEVIDVYNPTTDGNIINEVEFMPKDVIDDLLVRAGITNPIRDSKPLSPLNNKDNIFGSGVDDGSIPDIIKRDDDNTPSIEDVTNSINNRKSIRVIKDPIATSGSVKINLECGSVEGLMERLGE